MTTIDLTQEVANKLAIGQLAHRFENAFDTGDIDAHMATWADDMLFESPFGSYSNRNAYREWVSGFMQQTKMMGGTRHIITNTEIEVQGKEATMYCYLVILNQQKRSILASSTFRDYLQKINGQWKFTRRVLQIDQDLSLLVNG